MSDQATTFLRKMNISPDNCVLEESPYGTSVLVRLPNGKMHECHIEDAGLKAAVVQQLKAHGTQVVQLKDPRK